MSVEVIVCIRDSELPSRDEWQRAIDEAGIALRFDQFSPREHTGFIPAKLDGQESGFEYFFQPIERDESEEVRERIGDRDRMVSFVCHSSEIDGRAAMLAAAVLARLVDGVFFDPQGGTFARGDGVFTMMEQAERDATEQRLKRAEQRWGHLTNRRCPKCSAPCPEYKNKCAVCGHAIGRA